jgi:uncharacterized phiE125 gp8 family phage protein
MQVREKASQTLTEPVTVAEFKTFTGYPGTDQDTLIASLITAARTLLESESGLSAVSKTYEAEFDRYDMISEDLSKAGYSGYDDGWFKLPFSPVTSITSVKIGGVATTYSQKGQKIVFIHPDVVVQTGTTGNMLQVEFVAGASDTIMKNAIIRIASDLFNNREDQVSVSLSSVSFDTRRLIASLNCNSGF